MSESIYRLRVARSCDWPALSSFVAAADLDAIDASEDNADDQLLLAFCLAEDGSERLVGSVRMQRNIGLDQPRYWYHLGTIVHAAPDLGLYHRQQMLLLGNDLTGAIELSDLSIDPRLAPSVHEQLTLVLVRAAVRALVDASDTSAASKQSLLIAAIPGLRDANGESPFWGGLGRHFYSGDVAHAMARFGSAWLTHVAALLPRHPLVASLLQTPAQAAIGAMGEHAHFLHQALFAAGLRAGQHVSLFDGGPIFQATPEQLVRANNWRRVSIEISDASSDPPQATKYVFVCELAQTQFWYLPCRQEGEGKLYLSPEVGGNIAAQQGSEFWLCDV